MIYTLTLNPAIDRTIYVDELNLDDVTRVQSTLRDAAGKGINVSKVLKQLDQLSVCLGFIGGSQGNFIQSELSKKQVLSNFVEVDGETRENIKVIIDNPRQVLELNQQGPSISESNIDQLYQIMDITLREGDILVLSGSIPKGVPQNIYKKIIVRYPFVKTFLDVSGDVFKESVVGSPYAIKPNLYELELYKGKKLSDINEIIEVCHEFLDLGVKHVFVSLGKDGALYVSKKETIKVTVPNLKAKSTVGAGDSFVAGIVHGYSKTENIEEILLSGCSVGSASVLSENTASITIEDVNEIRKQLVIEKL